MSVALELEAVCKETGCNQIKDAWVHSELNTERGHFFNAGAPLLSVVRTESTPEPVRNAAPNPKRRDPRTCVICGKVRGRHRGAIKHRFEAPGNSPLEFDGQWARAATPSEGQMVDAIRRALLTLRIAPRQRIGEVRVVPLYAIDNDSELLSAKVFVEMALIFPREEL